MEDLSQICEDESSYRMWVVSSLATIKEKVDGLKSAKEDHETRLRSMERRSWQSVGAAGIITLIIPVAMKLLKI
jgi:hypothetical protein